MRSVAPTLYGENSGYVFFMPRLILWTVYVVKCFPSKIINPWEKCYDFQVVVVKSIRLSKFVYAMQHKLGS